MKSDQRKPHCLFNPITQLVLYSLLIVATPFLLVTNYMQSAIGNFSHITVTLFGLEFSLIIALMIAVFLSILLIFRSYLSWLRILMVLLCILLIYLSQNITDYYFGHKFYDIQQNWHYVAYCLYSFILYRALTSKGVSTPLIILYTYISALVLSTFDELFQLFMSNRIFDISDIAKDSWGSSIGLILVFFVIEQGEGIKRYGFKVRQNKVKGYFQNPFSLLVLGFIFSFLLLVLSSLLTEARYWKEIIVFVLSLFVVIFLIIHLTNQKVFKIVFSIVLVLCLGVQSYFYFKYRDENIIYNANRLVVYKGIPIPFFDVLIFPNGFFRLVDKKESFTLRDRQFFFKKGPDILLIGNGIYGKGGKGFPKRKPAQFVYNWIKNKGMQVIIMRTPSACEEFNRLRKEGKNVLFIIHNT